MERLQLGRKLLERQFLERFELEHRLLVGPLLERFELVGKLLERQLVERRCVELLLVVSWGDGELRGIRAACSASRSLVQGDWLPLSREVRSAAASYVPATDWRLRRHVLRHQDGRDKEVHVRESLTRRDASRFKAWKAGLAAFVLALVVGGMHPGASWGASSYDPASDPYSMQNVTAGDGVQAWWSAGDTGQGVDVAVIDTGVVPVPALSGANKIVNGPDLSLESQAPSLYACDW